MVAGLVDAVSILRLGRVFVANMTGNVVFIGFGLAGAPGFSLGGALVAVAGFVVGAAATAWLPAGWTSQRGRVLQTGVTIKVALAVPVVVVASVDHVRPGGTAAYVLTVLLAASMGVQNAIVRRLGLPELTTTVLTRTMTGLFADLRSHGWRATLLGYPALSVVFLFGGAVLGAVLVLDVSTASALGLALAILTMIGTVAHLACRRHAAWALSATE